MGTVARRAGTAPCLVWAASAALVLGAMQPQRSHATQRRRGAAAAARTAQGVVPASLERCTQACRHQALRGSGRRCCSPPALGCMAALWLHGSCSTRAAEAAQTRQGALPARHSAHGLSLVVRVGAPPLELCSSCMASGNLAGPVVFGAAERSGQGRPNKRPKQTPCLCPRRWRSGTPTTRWRTRCCRCRS